MTTYIPRVSFGRASWAAPVYAPSYVSMTGPSAKLAYMASTASLCRWGRTMANYASRGGLWANP